jgi:hypothetical protein
MCDGKVCKMKRYLMEVQPGHSCNIETEKEETMATKKTTGRRRARTARRTARKTARTTRTTARKTARVARRTGQKVARAARRKGRKVARAVRKTGRKVARTTRKAVSKRRSLKANLGQKEATQQELSEEQMSHMEGSG